MATDARRVLFAALLVAAVFGARIASADPRPPAPMDAAAIRAALEKLTVTGSVLYVGAHPDDENSALLAWLSNGRKVRTAYLSLTRGDGGQSLIGVDTGENLGVIRTQELLGARRIDGAEQFFTRALDFGFSKNADETLAIWDHDRILSDVVWVIRRFRPDVIITRFAPDSTAGHGHHWASAILAEEAFAAAADSTRFRGQLAFVRPWQAKRLLRNIARFGNAGPDTTRGRLNVDLGAYDPLLGRSYTEIGGESRSMHKTQGFGAAERRGSYTNTFEHRAGVRATNDLFDGVDLTWGRFAGGAKMTPLLRQAGEQFRADKPGAIVPLLLEADSLMARLPADLLIDKKRLDLANLIRACAGLWLEAVASAPSATPGHAVRITTLALDRSDVPITVNGVVVSTRPSLGSAAMISKPNPSRLTLASNIPAADTFWLSLPPISATSEPYWLAAPSLAGSFVVSDSSLVGRSENPPQVTARFDLSIAGRKVWYTTPVVYRWIDPVAGERYRDFAVVPLVTLRFDHGAYLFGDGGARDMRVTATSADTTIAGDLTLTLPAGWTSTPPRVRIRLRAGEAETTVTFHVTPAATPTAGTVTAFVEAGGDRFDRRLVRLDYPHIPVQTLLPPAEAHLVRADLRTAGHAVAYVMGPGDEGPDALRQMGYEVTLLGDEDLERADLSRYDAIVIGVRAYNTRPRLRQLQRRLNDYVAAGGRLVVQYQTPEDAIQDRIGPWPLHVSRDRVTVETAPMTPLKPDHPLLTTPNRIAASDWDGWVQERGLWYARPADPRYERVVTSHDPHESDLDGGLLYTTYGKGTFVFTALAFFRQLPAGVPGAWRLFANLVSPPPAHAAAPAP
ncbi:MAG: PIG-L family deacetylase [Candidatus Eisenbacteria bacterium]|nr:PIG-L family deacetylase [Candidatus Eisenbacteria bacterium]